MKITLDVKRTNVCTCKHCSYEAVVHHHLLFDSAAVYFNRLHLLIHAITHHWALLPRKAHWMAPYYLLRGTLTTALCWMLDVLHAALWAMTWPFWWLHEEVL